MKTLVSIAVVIVAVLGWRLAGRTGFQPVTRPAGILPASPSPTTTTTNNTQVFQQAFWKRPSASDRILNAERREWKDKNGIAKWQWFIAVQPSPELLKHLRDNNAFDLVRASSASSISDAPSWFTFDPARVSMMHSPIGQMKLIFDEQRHTLFATDAGGGFKPSAAEPGKPFPQTAATGRLPSMPPPKP